MITFALITEGETDQAVIENILIGFLGTYDIDVNPLLPLKDRTDRARDENFSNWKKVFDYCASSKFKEAFQVNQYVIVQIDTDVSEEIHYEIPKYEEGEKLSPEKLIERVVQKFIKLIGEEFYNKYSERIIFAISVHSLECWLLPLYCDAKPQDSAAEAIDDCFNRLNRLIKKVQKSKNRLIFKKDYRIYDRISEDYRKNKILMKNHTRNPSLKIFIEQLQTKTIIIEEDY